jgi:exosortase B
VSASISARDRSVGTLEPHANAWLIALVGFAAMYLPVYWWAAGSIWQSEEHGHGFIILAVLVWLFWRQRHAIATAPVQSAPVLGWTLFAVGLLIYIMGRAFAISILEFASQPLIVAAALLLVRGPAALRVAWFPLLYFVFMIPLPGMLVDLITGSLKQWVAGIVETGLYAMGYPIARTGVIMSIGPYQLQVADACSGLHSMFSLAALGTLFMYVMGRKRRLHSALMLASIFPIAFAANIVRVAILVLITYHLGDEAGQGFMHGAAGMVLMLVALFLFFALDRVLGRLLPEASSSARPSLPRPASAGR